MKRLNFLFALALLIISAATGYSMPKPSFALTYTCAKGDTYSPAPPTFDPVYNACVMSNGTRYSATAPTTVPNSGSGSQSSGTGSNSGSQSTTTSGSNSGSQSTTSTGSNSGSQSTTGTGSNSGSQSQTSPCKPDDTACQTREASKAACAAKKDQGYVLIKAFGDDHPNTGDGHCVTMMEFFQTLINYFLMFASIIAGIMFARGAYGILTSRGTPQSVTEARDTLTNAVIGLILIALAFVVIKFLNGAFSTIDGSINLLGPFVQ